MDRLYSGPEAKKYLSIDGKPLSQTQFALYVMRGEIVPDLKNGRRMYFYESTLKDAKKRIRNEEDYTLEEIHEMIIVQDSQGDIVGSNGLRYSHLTIKPRNLIYHFNGKRNIEPTGKRRGANTYSIHQIKMVAKSQGWLLKSDIHELQLPHSPEGHQSSSAQSEQSQEIDP